jgi:hypothetical protein
VNLIGTAEKTRVSARLMHEACPPNTSIGAASVHLCLDRPQK